MLNHVSKLSRRLNCHGAACTAQVLKDHFENKIPLDETWKGDHPNHIQGANCSIAEALEDLNSVSDLAVLELVAIAKEYKEAAIKVKCRQSSKDWRQFCLAQLTSGGARILHRFVNRQNAAPPVALFKRDSKGVRPTTPNQAVQCDAEHWSSFWSVSALSKQAADVCSALRARCRLGL